MLGQYVLPPAFVLGAGISAFKQYSRRKLHAGVANSPGLGVLDGMSWQDFEVLVGESFRQKGFQVEEVGGGGPDDGIDLILSKNGQKHLVQCKQWKAYKVGVKPVRELVGVMVGQGAAGGIVVTSGSFTQDAVAFAKDNNVQLIDGKALHAMIRGARQATPMKNKALVPPATATATVCPKCGSVMVKRTAQKGARAGEQFWGCSNYPACRSTLPLKAVKYFTVGSI
jgi:restriction system protein